MGKRVLSVLRSGGDFEPRHVQAMARQIERWAPNARFQCLSDTDVPGVECTPLKHDWPGWWSKLELFRPDLGGDFLFTDLDNVILGPLDDILARPTYTTQRKGWTALMYVPPDFGASAYEALCRADMTDVTRTFDPPRAHQTHGDAAWIAQFASGQCWADVLPGQTMNIVEMRFSTAAGFRWRNRIPSCVRVMLCGKPYRPWLLPLFQHLYQEKV